MGGIIQHPCWIIPVIIDGLFTLILAGRSDTGEYPDRPPPLFIDYGGALGVS